MGVPLKVFYQQMDLVGTVYNPALMSHLAAAEALEAEHHLWQDRKVIQTLAGNFNRKGVAGIRY